MFLKGFLIEVDMFPLDQNNGSGIFTFFKYVVFQKIILADYF